MHAVVDEIPVEAAGVEHADDPVHVLGVGHARVRAALDEGGLVV